MSLSKILLTLNGIRCFILQNIEILLEIAFFCVCFVNYILHFISARLFAAAVREQISVLGTACGSKT
jgi:hypothetical protein